MAWRSSGSSNDEMIDNLCRFGVISSEVIERGFRAVDRKFFVPKGNESSAHSDQPLKEGNVHMSAPHIYGASLEALELHPNSSLSFLNIGSGTGYLSCIVGEILGPKSLNFGVEIHQDVIEHSHEAVKKWYDARANVRGREEGPHLEIVHGNGLFISPKTGESLVGFDRIYVGAAIERSRLAQITRLLSPGGILVGPVDDELVKVVRIGPIKEESSSMDDDDEQSRSSDDDNASESESNNSQNEFTTQVLSGVRFASLLEYPTLDTVIPARAWSPDAHRYFPDTFQRASLELLLCSNSDYVQPPPAATRPENRVNFAAMLPRVLWMEILSFAHRKWFTPEDNETEFLKKRLLEEQANAAKAQRARLEMEVRCQVAERERDVYRLLARRWQSRLHAVLQQQREAVDGSNGASASAIEREISLGAILLSGADAGDDLDDQIIQANESAMDEDGAQEMEEDEEAANATTQSQELEGHEEEGSDDAYEYFSAKGEASSQSRQGGEDESVVMSDADDDHAEGPTNGAATGTYKAESLKARAVSISSDDLQI